MVTSVNYCKNTNSIEQYICIYIAEIGVPRRCRNQRWCKRLSLKSNYIEKFMMTQALCLSAPAHVFLANTERGANNGDECTLLQKHQQYRTIYMYIYIYKWNVPIYFPTGILFNTVVPLLVPMNRIDAHRCRSRCLRFGSGVCAEKRRQCECHIDAGTVDRYVHRCRCKAWGIPRAKIYMLPRWQSQKSTIYASQSQIVPISINKATI